MLLRPRNRRQDMVESDPYKKKKKKQRFHGGEVLKLAASPMLGYLEAGKKDEELKICLFDTLTTPTDPLQQNHVCPC